MFNSISQKITSIYPGNNTNTNNPQKNGLGGIWSWNNNGIWTDFDPQASKQIDDQIRSQWKNTNNNVITFPITKGPWFGQNRNAGVYFCNVQLNHSRKQIKTVMQQNIKTGFGRQMKRIPPFQLHPHNKHKNNQNNSQYNNNKHQSGHNNKNKHNSHYNSNNNNNNSNNKHNKNYSGHNSNNNNKQSHNQKHNNNNNKNKHFPGNNNSNVTTHVYFNNNSPYNYTQPNPSSQFYGTMTTGPHVNSDGSVSWSWQDDYAWKVYDNATITQIENAYNANKMSVVLNQGPYFGASHRQGYMIQFDRHNIPPTFTQVNTTTRYERNVARTGGNTNNQMNNNQINNNQINNNNNMANTNNNNNNNQMNSNNSNNNSNSNDKHSQWRQYFRPMITSHFKTLKDKDKLCNICFCEFDEKELFENECDEFKKQIQSQTQPLPQTNEVKKEEKKDEKDNDGDTPMDSNNNSNSNDNNNNNKSKIVSDYNISDQLLNKITDNTIIYLSQCGTRDHYFHSECISRWLNEKGKCCHCQKRYAIETGNQPLNGRLNMSFLSYACQGYQSYGTIKIIFQFDSGTQGQEHYHPGQPYHGDHREVYFPNNEQGREAVELTKIAFQRRLIFTIGASLTTKKENRIVWGSIHFKSRMEGGQQRHGYPDETYFDRFKEELKAKGVTVEDIDQQGKMNIKNGYGNSGGNMYSGYY